VNKTTEKTLREWRQFREDGEAVTIAEIFKFLTQRRRKREICPRDRAILDAVWLDMVLFVAKRVEVYVFQVYAKERDMNSLPTVLRSGSRVKGGCIDPETAWAVLERSHGLFSATPESVAAVKSDENAYLGLTSRTGTKCLCVRSLLSLCDVR